MLLLFYVEVNVLPLIVQSGNHFLSSDCLQSVRGNETQRKYAIGSQDRTKFNKRIIISLENVMKYSGISHIYVNYVR